MGSSSAGWGTPAMTSAARMTSTAAERTWLMISVSARSGSCSKASRAWPAALRARSRASAARCGSSWAAARVQTRLGQLAHRVDQAVGGDQAGARVAQGVAREHARVAHREVQVGQRARVALQQAAGAAARRREADHLARGREGLLERAQVAVDGARLLQRAPRPARSRPRRAPSPPLRASRRDRGRPTGPRAPRSAWDRAGRRGRRRPTRRRRPSAPPGSGRASSPSSWARSRPAAAPRPPPRRPAARPRRG